MKSKFKFKFKFNVILSIAALFMAGIVGLSLQGCGSTPKVPTSYTDGSGQTVAYTADEQKILQYCAAVEQDLPLIQGAAVAATSGWLTYGIKQDATKQADGLMAWQVAHGVYSLTGGNLPAPNAVTSYVNSIIGDNKSVVDDVNQLLQIITPAYITYYGQLQAYLGQTNSFALKLTIVKTGLDVLKTIANGVQIGAGKYAPAAPPAS